MPEQTNLDVLIAVLHEEVEHRCGWLSEMILSRGDEHEHRSFDLFDEFLALSLDVVQFRVLLLDSCLIGEDDQSIALLVILFEFPRNGDVPPDPILVI